MQVISIEQLKLQQSLYPATKMGKLNEFHTAANAFICETVFVLQQLVYR